MRNTPLSSVLRIPNADTSERLADAFRNGLHTVEDRPRQLSRRQLYRAALSVALIWSAALIGTWTAESGMAAAFPLGFTIGMLSCAAAALAGAVAAAPLTRRFNTPSSMTIPSSAWESQVWRSTVVLLNQALPNMPEPVQRETKRCLAQLHDSLTAHYLSYTVHGSAHPQLQHHAANLACQIAEHCFASEQLTGGDRTENPAAAQPER